MTNKHQLKEGVILAAALTKLVDGYALMSILNTTDVETEVQGPVVQLEEIEPEWVLSSNLRTEREIFSPS
jgi:hypothetical protein